MSAALSVGEPIAVTYARLGCELDAAALPAATRQYARLLLLDGIGCLMAGARGRPAAMAAAALTRMGSPTQGPATDLVRRVQTSARDAAFANGIALYSVGVNDIHRPAIVHPGGGIIPVLLAAGQARRSTGADLIAAMVAGYELTARLGRAMHPSHWDRGFHPTGTFNTFGATLAAGRLMQLSHAQLVCALGIAGSQAAGVQAFHTDGTLTMVFHAGRAAQNGIEAAALASEGFTGPATVFEDPRGFMPAFSDTPDTARMTTALGESWELDATSFRPFYGCTLTIAASAATQDLLAPPVRPDDIEEAVVRVHPDAPKIIDDGNPQTLLAARLSMQFNVALVLRRGAVLVGDATDADLQDPVIRKLIGRVRVAGDASQTLWGSHVLLRLRDGSVRECQMDLPKGDPQNPMSWEDTVDKFRQVTAQACTADGADRIIGAIRALEDIRVDALVDTIAAGQLRSA
jgi:2-methylcitrate dehydratase PrpD